jgi:hypothetical protein
MYFYSVSQSTPDGLEFQLDLQHEKEFKQKDFTDICCDAFIHGYKIHKRNHDFVLKSCYDTDAVVEYFYSLGFTNSKPKLTAYFDLDPWSEFLTPEKISNYYKKEDL